MTGTENGFPDFFFQETTKKEQHDYLELEKHMHSIWVVLIEPFLKAMLLVTQLKARLYLCFFHGSEIPQKFTIWRV